MAVEFGNKAVELKRSVNTPPPSRRSRCWSLAGNNLALGCRMGMFPCKEGAIGLVLKTQKTGREIQMAVILCAVILLLVATATPAAELTNATYLRITRSQAAGDLGGMIRLLPEVEDLWPQEPEAYFACMYEAAASLVSAPTNDLGAKTVLSGVLANALHKPCPADTKQAIACIELKGMIAVIGPHHDAENENAQKATLMDMARFVGEAASRSTPQEDAWLRLPRLAHDILVQEGATDRSHLVDSSLGKAYDDIIAEYERAAITNHLASVARKAGSLVRPLLVGQCRRLFPADNPQNMDFINGIISAAGLGNWDSSLLKTPPVAVKQPQLPTIDVTTGLPTPDSIALIHSGIPLLNPSTGLPFPADYIEPLPWKKPGTAALWHATDLITDPLEIQFSSWFAELYHNSRNVSGTIILDSGAPTEMTVVVKGLSNELVWQPFSTNFTCTLGEKDGAYELSVGLRGTGRHREPVWFPMDEILDRVPPVVVITSPVPGVTSQPVVQLLGYSSKETGHMRCALTNSNGAETNLSLLPLGSNYDPVRHEITPNWFECTDLNLAKGTNSLTVWVSDRAGNETVSNLTVVLDYSKDTTPPVLLGHYPMNGDRVSGGHFVMHGMLDDPTATIKGKIVDRYGNTNYASGETGRTGWCELADLPLADGTNWLTVTMKDAAGNVATTNFDVIGSPLKLTVDHLSWDQMMEQSNTVTGTIDSRDYTVWFNGMKVTNYVANGQGGWDWKCEGEDLFLSALVSYPMIAPRRAVAIPNSDNGGNGSFERAVARGNDNPTSPGAVKIETGL